MKLKFYSIGDNVPRIRAASAKRDWMDQTPEGYAYRCLPLNIANQHGWDFLTTVAVKMFWSGRNDIGAISIEPIDPTLDTTGLMMPISHFGSGVVTFDTRHLVRTEPGYDLWVSGPANHPRDGLIPLTGLVETDWSPFTFTMNYKFTKPGTWAYFGLEEPFCTVFPIRRGELEEVEPEVIPLWTEPELETQFHEWSNSRFQFLAGLSEHGSEEAKRGWQKDYFKGRDKSGKKAPEHRTKLKLREPVSY